MRSLLQGHSTTRCSRKEALIAVNRKRRVKLPALMPSLRESEGRRRGKKQRDGSGDRIEMKA